MGRIVVVFFVVLLGTAPCFADLIPIAPVGTNQVPSSGAGYGSVLTLLNAHNTSGSNADGLETNCNILSGGAVLSACTGPFATMPGGLNDPGNQNETWSIAATGITDPSQAASQLLLVFNINQEGSDTTITLQNLGLALWYNGSPIFSALTATNDTYNAIAQGIGQAGWGYQLDSTQAAAAQTAINTAILGGATLNNIFVTGAFRAGCLTGTAGCANDGPDTLFLDAHGATVSSIPEPASIVALGTALLAIAGGLLRRRKA